VRPQNEIAEIKFYCRKSGNFCAKFGHEKLNSNSVADILGFLGISPSRENREKFLII
jgi:hypothetical protein